MNICVKISHGFPNQQYLQCLGLLYWLKVKSNSVFLGKRKECLKQNDVLPNILKMGPPVGLFCYFLNPVPSNCNSNSEMGQNIQPLYSSLMNFNNNKKSETQSYRLSRNYFKWISEDTFLKPTAFKDSYKSNCYTSVTKLKHLRIIFQNMFLQTLCKSCNRIKVIYYRTPAQKRMWTWYVVVILETGILLLA